jgi:hypothetical protein
LRKSILVAIGLLIATAACGNLPRPFQPEYKTNKTEAFPLTPIDRAGMVVRPVEGLPPAAAAALTTALIEALQKQDIAAMTGPGNPASLVLGGTATGGAGGWTLNLALADAQRKPLGAVAAQADRATDDPAAWSPVAAQLAKSVAGLLESDPTLRPGDQPKVAIGEITGVAAGNQRMLINALEYALRQQHIQLAATPGEATHVVNGAVAIAPPRGAAGHEVRNVDVKWIVLHADKSEVGRVEQANDVPAALLDQAWPDIAMAVADAAAGGIIDLVNRRPTVTR